MTGEADPCPTRYGGSTPVTGPEHYRKADELAAEAHRLLGQGEGLQLLPPEYAVECMSEL